jgi:hypothetical protein
MSLSDDLPHPVPAFAQLRYKENWFFILLAPDSQAFGVIHFNHEPAFDRVRYTANFEIAGQSTRYADSAPFPEDFAFARTIGNGVLDLAFGEGRFALTLDTPELGLAIDFTARQAVYDYAASRTCGNPAPSFQEVMTLGLNLPYNHQQQALDATGTARLADGRQVAIAGSGYRDHSWVMRADAGSLEHTWSGLNFPGRSFGIKTIATLDRPANVAMEGYVANARGTRALRQISVRREGAQADGLCERLVQEVVDVFGERYTIVCDLAGRHAHVPLVSEAPKGKVGYHIVENFCPLTLLETGEHGVGLVEIGRSSLHAGPFA